MRAIVLLSLVIALATAGCAFKANYVQPIPLQSLTGDEDGDYSSWTISIAKAVPDSLVSQEPAGLREFTIHELRRSLATGLVNFFPGSQVVDASKANPSTLTVTGIRSKMVKIGTTGGKHSVYEVRLQLEYGAALRLPDGSTAKLTGTIESEDSITNIFQTDALAKNGLENMLGDLKKRLTQIQANNAASPAEAPEPASPTEAPE